MMTLSKFVLIVERWAELWFEEGDTCIQPKNASAPKYSPNGRF
jgi:hypothetical protein